jgi:hypothetical protein
VSARVPRHAAPLLLNITAAAGTLIRKKNLTRKSSGGKKKKRGKNPKNAIIIR